MTRRTSDVTARAPSTTSTTTASSHTTVEAMATQPLPTSTTMQGTGETTTIPRNTTHTTHPLAMEWATTTSPPQLTRLTRTPCTKAVACQGTAVAEVTDTAWRSLPISAMASHPPSFMPSSSPLVVQGETTTWMAADLSKGCLLHFPSVIFGNVITWWSLIVLSDGGEIKIKLKAIKVRKCLTVCPEKR